MPGNSGSILDVKQWPVIFFGFVLSCLLLLLLRLGSGWVDKLDKVADSMGALTSDMRVFLKEQNDQAEEIKKLQVRATNLETKAYQLELENERLKARLYRNNE